MLKTWEPRHTRATAAPRLPLIAEGEGVLTAATRRKVSLIHGGFMADPQVLTTLRRKQAEIENAIAAYEKRAEEARRDLVAINAAIRLFSVALRAPPCCSL
jgi:hypothetical protein